MVLNFEGHVRGKALHIDQGQPSDFVVAANGPAGGTEVVVLVVLVYMHAGYQKIDVHACQRVAHLGCAHVHSRLPYIALLLPS